MLIERLPDKPSLVILGEPVIFPPNMIDYGRAYSKDKCEALGEKVTSTREFIGDRIANTGRLVKKTKLLKAARWLATEGLLVGSHQYTRAKAEPILENVADYQPDESMALMLLAGAGFYITLMANTWLETKLGHGKDAVNPEVNFLHEVVKSAQEGEVRIPIWDKPLPMNSGKLIAPLVRTVMPEKSVPFWHKGLHMMFELGAATATGHGVEGTSAHRQARFLVASPLVFAETIGNGIILKTKNYLKARSGVLDRSNG